MRRDDRYAGVVSFQIRPASSQDAEDIEQIERDADQLLVELFRATDWPGPDAATERFAAAGFLLVAENDGVPVGFAHVLDFDGHAHLEQVSVLPRFSRRGAGRMLVAQALSRASALGNREMTLRTYADVPWNAPFYASCGFVETSPDSDALRRLIDVERRLGLFGHGRRIQMTATLAERSSSVVSR